jgi:2-polyprenyl-6-methoxyphenol hydroxylase-like FAD-dependent oxidoreductase
VQAVTGLDHHRVNHSDRRNRFVAPDGTHTQHIESYWAKRKQRIKAMRGMSREMLPEYLNEFMWRDKYNNDVFRNLLRHIAEQFTLKNDE